MTIGKATVDSFLRPITLGEAELFQVHTLFKLLFDAAPGFTFLQVARSIVKSGATVDGKTYVGINGLADLLLSKLPFEFTHTPDAIPDATRLSPHLISNLHADVLLSPADLATFQMDMNTALGGSEIDGARLMGSVIPSIVAFLDRVAPALLKQYVADSINVSQTYSTNRVNTSEDLSVLRLKDEPLLASGPINFTDTVADDTFTTQQGTLTVPPGFAIGTVMFGIEGGTVSGTTATKVLTYGTVSLNTTTGAYTFTPTDAAIEGTKTAVTESFKLTATDSATVPNSTWAKLRFMLQVKTTPPRSAVRGWPM